MGPVFVEIKLLDDQKMSKSRKMNLRFRLKNRYVSLGDSLRNQLDLSLVRLGLNCFFFCNSSTKKNEIFKIDQKASKESNILNYLKKTSPVPRILKNSDYTEIRLAIAIRPLGTHNSAKCYAYEQFNFKTVYLAEIEGSFCITILLNKQKPA